MKNKYIFLCIGLLSYIAFSSASAASLKNTLKQGVRNDDVKILQALLAADPDVYPQALVTGYYGTATVQAVKTLQRKNGITPTGTVGPLTLALLNKLNKNTPVQIKNIPVSTAATATVSVVCQDVPPGHLIAPGWIKKNGQIEVIPSCQVLPPGVAKQVSGTTTTPPTPDTTAPVISSLAFTASTTNIKISWLTNEYSTTFVYFSTTSPVNINTSNVQFLSGYTRQHEIVITGLIPDTQYYFIIASSDTKGNLATSSQLSAKTVITTDTLPPVFTWITSYPHDTSATIVWVTNEAATGTLYYSTSGPLLFASSSKATASSLNMSQLVTLTGLSTSTTYYFAIEARDTVGNIATSTLQSLKTQ